MPQVAARRHGTVFSSAISAATNAIQVRLMTPSANSAAISAQQQPKHQPACLEPISSGAKPPVAPCAEQESERAAALCQAHVLQRRQLVERGDGEDAAANHRPPACQARSAPNRLLPSSNRPYAPRPAAPHTSR